MEITKQSQLIIHFKEMGQSRHLFYLFSYFPINLVEEGDDADH